MSIRDKEYAGIRSVLDHSCQLLILGQQFNFLYEMMQADVMQSEPSKSCLHKETILYSETHNFGCVISGAANHLIYMLISLCKTQRVSAWSLER